MASVWHTFDPDLFDAYVASCKLLEGGDTRVRVLGDSVVMLVCYGGKRTILPAIYLSNVPTEWIERFKSSHKDAQEFVLSRHKDDEMAKLVTGQQLTEEEKKEVLRDAYTEFSAIEDTSSRMQTLREALKHYLER